MKANCRFVLWMLPVLMIIAPAAGAQSVTIEDFHRNAERMRDVRMLGMLFLSLRDPAKVEQVGQNLKNNYWAFKADVDLSAEQLLVEEALFRRTFDNLFRDVSEYRFDELKFAGLDLVCLTDCMDWYFAALTPKGPVLIKLRILFKGEARIFGVTLTKDWDEVKKVSRDIQLKPGKTVVSITLKPPAEMDEPKTNPAP